MENLVDLAFLIFFFVFGAFVSSSVCQFRSASFSCYLCVASQVVQSSASHLCSISFQKMCENWRKNWKATEFLRVKVN